MEEIIIAKRDGYILILNNRKNEYRIFSDELIDLCISGENKVKINISAFNVDEDKVQEIIKKINEAVDIAKHFTKIINEHSVVESKNSIKSCLHCVSMNREIGYKERGEIHCGWDGFPSIEINPNRAENCDKYEYTGKYDGFKQVDN